MKQTVSETVAYSEFRYGKLRAKTDSGARLIAQTPRLPKGIVPDEIVQCYSFGDTPPTVKSWAVGLVMIGDQLMIMKKSAALDGQGRMVSSGEREFNNARYLFVPTSEVTNILAAQNFRLLDWIFSETIPVYEAIDNSLCPPEVTPLQPTFSAVEENQLSEALWHSLQIRTADGTPLAILAIEAILAGKRLFINMREASNRAFWKALLLLLPAACRSEVAIAMGTLDESFCQWAQLVLKAGPPSPYSELPEELLQLDTAHGQILGDWNLEASGFEYTNILREIVAPLAAAPDETDQISQLLQVLDTANEPELSLSMLTRQILQPKLALKLAEFLPLEKRQLLYDKHLGQLSSQQWQDLLQLVVEKPEASASVWSQLHRRAVTEPGAFVPVLYQLWPCLSTKHQLAFLDGLIFQHCPALVEAWITTALLQQSEFTAIEPEVAAAWLGLAKSVIIARSQRDFPSALQFTKQLAKCQLFNECDRFWLFEATLAASSTKTADEIFNQQLSPQLAQIDLPENSYIYQHFVRQHPKAIPSVDLIAQNSPEALSYLPEIAVLTAMSIAQQDTFYIGFLRKLSPTFEQAKGLLKSLIENKLLVKSSSWIPSAELKQTIHWFVIQQAELSPVFAELRKGHLGWNALMCLAEILHEQPQEAIIYADWLVNQYDLSALRVSIIKRWLSLIEQGKAEPSKLQSNSVIWHSLSHKDIHAVAINSQQPQLLAHFIRELIASQRLNVIAGTLLHQVTHVWAIAGSIDHSLLTAIIDPAITEHYEETDWLAIAQVIWSHSLWDFTVQRPSRMSAKNCSQLVAYAKVIAQTYQDPKSVEKLLSDFSSWHLSPAQQREILLTYLPKPYRVDFIIRYLNLPSDDFDTSQRELIHTLLNLPLHTPEDQQQYKQFFSRFLQQFLTGNQHNWLTEPSLEPNRRLYREAAYNLVERLLTTQFNIQMQLGSTERSVDTTSDSLSVLPVSATY